MTEASRFCSEYHTILNTAAQVTSWIPLIDLLVEKRMEIHKNNDFRGSTPIHDLAQLFAQVIVLLADAVIKSIMVCECSFTCEYEVSEVQEFRARTRRSEI